MKQRVYIVHKVTSRDPRSFYKQARSLSKEGFQVVVAGLFPTNDSVDGIEVVRFDRSGGRAWRFLITNYRVFRSALKARANVYHFHDLDFVPWAVLLKLLTKSIVIYDIHEAYPEYMLLKTYIPLPLRRALSLLVRILEQVSVRCFDAIIPNDNFIAAGFRHPTKVTIFNFPTLDFFRAAPKIAWESRPYDLFYHGSLPVYHVERMMAIAEELDRSQLTPHWGIVTNDQETVTWARRELSARGLGSRFTFLPYTDYLKVVEYLNLAKIGIIPLPAFEKFMKNIPLKMFEFMGCGLPMVLSDLPPSRQFIEGKDCAIAVEADNTRDYAKAIQALLSNPARAVEMGRNGQELVFRQHNWGSEEGKLLGLYSRLIENRR